MWKTISKTVSAILDDQNPPIPPISPKPSKTPRETKDESKFDALSLKSIRSLMVSLNVWDLFMDTIMFDMSGFFVLVTFFVQSSFLA